MPIQVTCPGCLTRFQVNEKFAGKKGPCPKCKNQIQIPDKAGEVVVHAPEDMGPKDSKGRPVLKPIAREEVTVTRAGVLIVAGAVLAAIFLAIGLRISGGVPIAARVLGVILIAPPLVWAGYTFAREQELEPYRGRELWIRVGICSAIFAGLWLIYTFLPGYLFEYERPSEMPYLIAGVTLATMTVLGALASMATFELEFGAGLIHSALYFVGTLALAVIAGLPLAGVSG